MSSRYHPIQDAERARLSLLRALADPRDGGLLLTGETGMGKSTLIEALRESLDRRTRVVYFAHARHLKAAGLVRALARVIRLPTRRSHPETVQEVARTLAEEPVLLVLDQAHELPEDTLVEACALAEHDLGRTPSMRILLVGLPVLRGHLQGNLALWRRFAVREELSGLRDTEVPRFLEHSLGNEAVERFAPPALALLFQRGRGAPGQILPMARHLLRTCSGSNAIDELAAEEELQRWDLE